MDNKVDKKYAASGLMAYKRKERTNQKKIQAAEDILLSLMASMIFFIVLFYVEKIFESGLV